MHPSRTLRIGAYQAAADPIEYNGSDDSAGLAGEPIMHHWNKWATAVGVCAGLLSSGCWKAAPAPPLPSPVAASPPAAAPAEPVVPPPAEIVEAESPSQPAAAPVSTSEAAPAVDAAPDHGVERIILLAPANPIIIDLQLTIDGQPHTAALEKLVQEVLKLADTDGDGQTLWKELGASKRIKYGQCGNLANENDTR